MFLPAKRIFDEIEETPIETMKQLAMKHVFRSTGLVKTINLIPKKDWLKGFK